MKELGRIKKPFRICFEATTGYGWLYERLSAIAESVQVAHPGQVRLIFKAKRKTDRIDARKLAQLLKLNALPTVHVPSAEMRAWRRLIEYRQREVQSRARTKNQIRALLRRHVIAAPPRLWSAKGIAWLRDVALPSIEAALERDLSIATLRHLDAVIARVEVELKRRAQRHPGVALLETIPGVGPRTAEAMVAYIDRPERFDRVKAIGCYIGLIPCEDSSAGKSRLGHITRQGPATPRRLLGEAAWQAVRRCSEIRAVYERIHQGHPDRKKIAIVAVAHYLARMMLAMLKTGEVCRFAAA